MPACGKIKATIKITHLFRRYAMQSTITQDLVKELLDYREGKLYWRVNRGKNKIKGKEAGGRTNKLGYARVGINNCVYQSHRVIWLWHYGQWPENKIDHIDQDKLNNRIENLRDVTQAENTKNQRITTRNNSGYIGVSWSRENKKWNAYIKLNKKKIHLGYFINKEDAASIAYAARHQLGFHENHGS